MTPPNVRPGPDSCPAARTVAAAWAVTLLVSALPDIVLFKLGGAVPLWLLWAKMGLLAALIVASWPWKPIAALCPFLVMLLAIAALNGANAWLLGSPGWMAWQLPRSFSVVALVAQAFEVLVALLLIGVLFVLLRRRERFFLVRGDLGATSEPVRWLGARTPGPLWRFGLVFTAVVVVVQVFMLILPLKPSAASLGRLLPLVPVILLLAAANGFTEELTLRAAPIATVIDAVGRSHAVWMAAVFFGLAHFIGGVPSGVPGVLTTTFLGWFFGKCMVESRGFFWPWLFHAVQDILPFTMMALAVMT